MKPKVVIIMNRLSIGGQQVDTVSLAYYLQEDFDILLLYGEKEADEVEASFLLQQYPGLRVQKVKSLRRTINPFTDVLALFKLIQLIKLHKASVVHTHGSKSGILGRVAAKLVGVKTIVHTFHGHLFHSYFNSLGSWLVKQVEFYLAKMSTHIITLSTLQYQELVEVYKIAPACKVSIIPLGISKYNTSISNEEHRTHFRKKFGLQPNDVAVGIIGRVVPIKNHRLFLEVAEYFIQQNSNIYFFIIGDGGGMQSLMQLLNDKQIAYHPKELNAKIIFTSWIEDMLWAYEGLDIVMLTSLNEGTPVTIIEAQLCGKPVIAANVGGVKDTFIPNKTGILIDSHLKQDYIKALQNLVEQADVRNQMGKDAITFASNTFVKQKEVDAIATIYASSVTQ